MWPVLLGMVCPALQLANARLLLGGLNLPVLMPLDYAWWQWLDHSSDPLHWRDCCTASKQSHEPRETLARWLKIY